MSGARLGRPSRPVRLGAVEIVPLVDAVGTLGALADLFPGVSATGWEPYRARHPELFAGPGAWRLPFGCFLVKSPSRTILVDTGVGPPPSAFLPEAQGWLLRDLRRHGVRVEDVDLVFLTHLHVDHVGWNAGPDGARTFPRARYMTHEAGWALVQQPRFRARDHVQRCLLSVERQRALDLVATSEVELGEGIVAVATPGHLPGHMSVEIAAGGRHAFIMGDVAVHPAQISEPTWAYAADADAEETIRTRIAVLRRLEGQSGLVLCGHYPGGIGQLRREASLVWEPRDA